MAKAMSPRFLMRLVLIVVLVALPLVYDNQVFLSNMVTVAVFAIIALGVSLVLGQAGQVSFAHAAFAGIGAYTAALLTTKLHVPTVGALLVAPLAAAIVSYVVGKPVLRFKFFFLALASIGLVSIYTILVTNLRSITGGMDGVPGIPILTVGGYAFDSFVREYYLIWGVTIVLLIFAETALRSRVGRALRAVAANEVAASTLGINTPEWKLRVFVLGSALAGLAGGFWALLIGSAAPGDWTLWSSILVMMMVVIGGVDSLLGALIGAAIIEWLGFSLSSYAQYSQGIFSVVFILLIIFLPGGLVAAVGRDRLHFPRSVMRRGAGRLRSNGAAAKPGGRETLASVATAGSLSLTGSTADVSGDLRSGRVGALAVPGNEARSLPLVDSQPQGLARSEDVAPVLQLEDVSVDFGGVQAVSHVSLQAFAGSVTAIIGPNGAGKTTLFNVVSGLQKSSGGRVWFNGTEITHMKPQDIARLGMARTFQNLRIFGNMSVLENVMVGRHRHERSHFLAAGLRIPSQRREESESRREAMRVLEMVGLADRANWAVTSLPYGQQRLVEIARALATEPRLVLLDEPAAGMNASERSVLLEKIKAIRDSGVDVLLVEHNMELVMGISDAVAVLDHGSLICCDTPSAVQCDIRVIEAYLGVAKEGDGAIRVRQSRPGMEQVEARPSSSGGSILQVTDLSTFYGSICAVRAVNLDVKAGDVLAVLGANGAGKTTLLQTISGALQARSGHVLFEGRDVTHLSSPAIMNLGICQVAEGRHIFPTLSVSDNLEMGSPKAHKGEEYRALLQTVFDLFPVLADRRRQHAGSLSGGEQQMLAIGRALMGRPKLLLLDEPSMGLGPLIVEAIFQALAELNERGLSIMMVEQNAEAALSIASRAAVMVTGEVVLTGTAADISGDPNLHALYLGGGVQVPEAIDS